MGTEVAENTSDEKRPKRIYPSVPLVGVGAVICVNGRFLLIRRANEPGRGLWSIPGGLVEVGEKIRDAVKREVEEETGLKVEVGRLIDVLDNIIYDEGGRIKFHYVLVDFEAKPIGDNLELRPSSEVLEARWFTIEEMRNLPITKTTKILFRKMGIEI